jgi:hypothetical protein
MAKVILLLSAAYLNGNAFVESAWRLALKSGFGLMLDRIVRMRP